MNLKLSQKYFSVYLGSVRHPPSFSFHNNLGILKTSNTTFSFPNNIDNNKKFSTFSSQFSPLDQLHREGVLKILKEDYEAAKIIFQTILKFDPTHKIL